MPAVMATRGPRGSRPAPRSPTWPFTSTTFSPSYSQSKNSVSKVTMKSLEETVKEQGGEEFLAMVKEVKIKAKWR